MNESRPIRSWPIGDSDMAKRVRAHDWAATPLGPIDTWPADLRSAVAFVLETAFPTALVWGPDLVTIYNDAFRPILGGKPEALGRSFAEIWSEAWHEIGPITESAFAGRSTFIEDYPLVINRAGQPEQAYFTFSYSPVRTAEGTVGGMIDTVVETTKDVLARERLRENEARFRAFVTASSDVVYRMSPDWSEMRQLDGRDFLSDTVEPSETWMKHYIRPEDHRPVQTAIEQAIRTKSMFELEHPVRRADGTLGWTLSRAVPILDERGQVAEWLGAASDVTARKQAEFALRESEELFRSFADNSADTLWILNTRTQRLEYLSPAFESMWGETRARVIADLARWAELVHPDDRDWAKQALPRLLAGETCSQTYRIVRPRDGAVRFIQDTGFPIRSPDGSLHRVAGIAQDVTGQMEAQRRIAKSERRLRSLVEGIPQLVWRGIDGASWTWSSPQWSDHTGLSPEASRGRGWLEAVHPDDRDKAFAEWQAAEQAKSDLSAEYRIRRAADGRYRWFSTRATAVHDEMTGERLEWLGTSTDVDDIRSLQEHQKLLLAELQHRVRNTLAVVRSIARRSGETSETVEDYAMHFDGRLNAFARAQAVVTRNPGAGVDLAHIVAEELISYHAREGEQVRIEGPPLRLTPKAAETIWLTIHELATNAVKYGALSSGGGRIAITWSIDGQSAGRCLTFRWTESGVSIDQAAPRRKGFGTELLERTLTYDLGATVTVAFRPIGLQVVVDLPLTDRIALA